MLLSSELARYAYDRKTLRVSEPCKPQRSTYWLQLPYRWSVPLMVCMAVLHWLVSEALATANITALDLHGRPISVSAYYPDVPHSHPGVGDEEGLPTSWYGLYWSPAATLAAVCLGALMILFIFILGCWKYPSGIPVISSNTLALSAACHPSMTEPEDMVLRPLKYGVLQACSDKTVKATGFSAGEIGPLRAGEVYGGSLDLVEDCTANNDVNAYNSYLRASTGDECDGSTFNQTQYIELGRVTRGNTAHTEQTHRTQLPQEFV